MLCGIPIAGFTKVIGNAREKEYYPEIEENKITTTIEKGKFNDLDVNKSESTRVGIL